MKKNKKNKIIDIFNEVSSTIINKFEEIRTFLKF